MAIFRKFGMVLIILTIFSTSADCQITSLLNPQTVCIGKNVDLDWVYGNDANFLTVTWTYIDSQSSTKTIMQQITGGSAAPVNNYNVVPNTKFNGGITLTNVSIANTGSYKIRVTYSNASAVEDTVSVTVNDCSTCKCKCKCICRPHQIGGISTGVLGPLILPVAVGGRLQGCFSQTVGLAVNGIGFVLDIVSLGLSSSVQADNCCEECKEGEDCCNEQDCCEDEECCDDEKCCPLWIMGCSIAFIVISCVFAIVAIVIAVLLFKNRIGPLENGNNFCCGNNDGDGHDGHDDGNAHRKPRVHSEMEERHRETHSNRVNSDGAVSRQDVDFQENKGNIHGRPMPPITPQDRKGRGLSANYDDNHPMISVGIPDKKAGQLEPMEEEPRKKKKKKKKNVDEEDN